MTIFNKRVFLIFSLPLFSVGILRADEGIKVGGDFRYRHEYINQEDSDTENRHRIRARVKLSAPVNKAIQLKFRLISGSAEPISANQTLGGSFITKGVGLDHAYFSWVLAKELGLEILGGKFGVPYHRIAKTELLWDRDLSMEGVALKYAHKKSGVAPFLSAALLWVEENKAGDDPMLLGGQIGVAPKMDAVSLEIGGGYHQFTNTKGHPFFYKRSESFGNTGDSTSATGGEWVYKNEYQLIETFLGAGLKIAKIPVGVFGRFVMNIGADSANTGWLAGLSFGKAKKPHTWSFRYYFRQLEKDAIVGAFGFSDFGGGGTDNSGHEVTANYVLHQKTTMGVTYFFNQTAIENGKQYQRVQADAKFKF